nr:uncharacterized protein LOC105844366 [Hydra vulgaris]
MNLLVSNAIKARHLPNIRKSKNQLTEELKVLNNKSPVQPHSQSSENTEMDRFIPKQEDTKDYVALRSFKFEWLSQFSWLAYSSKEDGAYCLPCTLLGASIPNKSRILNLVFKPHQEWGNAVRDYRKHEESCVLDEKPMLLFNALLSRCNSKNNVIEVDLNNSRLKLLSDNQKKLVPIIKTIIFLGRNDLAFRDASKYHPDIGESSTQKVGIGNFIKLLNFCVDAEFRLDIQNCRGQGYDSAGFMAGKYEGVASQIKALNHKAIFVHCASHRLSLVVAAACQVQKRRWG